MSLRRYILNFAALITAVLLLVSFSGMRLYVHTCLGCDIKEVMLFGNNHDCCQPASSDMNAPAQNAGVACCAVITTPCQDTLGNHFAEDACCDTQYHYFLAEYETTPAKERSLQTEQDILILPMGCTDFANSRINEGIGLIISYRDPPPALTGKSFVIFAHCLKLIA